MRVFCYLHSPGNYEDEKVESNMKVTLKKKTTVFFQQINCKREREGRMEGRRERGKRENVNL